MLHEWLEVHRKTETDYWWFVNKRLLVRQILATYAPHKGRLLETGCGGGLFSSQLQTEGWDIISSDLAPAGARFAKQHGVSKALAFDAGHGWALADNTVEVFMMLDVLEHVELERFALHEALRVLKPGGIGIVSVPAYQFLFSAWDEYNKHFRRYTRQRLKRIAQQAGFNVLRSMYWNAISVPPAIALRLKDRILNTKLEGTEFPPVPGWVNATLKTYGRLEAGWLRYGGLPFGLSALVVLQKKEDA